MDHKEARGAAIERHGMEGRPVFRSGPPPASKEAKRYAFARLVAVRPRTGEAEPRR